VWLVPCVWPLNNRMFFCGSARDNGGCGCLGLQLQRFQILFLHAYIWELLGGKQDSNRCRHVANRTSPVAPTIPGTYRRPFAQAEQRIHAVHPDHRLARSSICSFFLNKVPHFIKLHHAHRLNLSGLRTKTFNVIAKLLNPAHNGCMRYAC